MTRDQKRHVRRELRWLAADLLSEMLGRPPHIATGECIEDRQATADEVREAIVEVMAKLRGR